VLIVLRTLRFLEGVVVDTRNRDDAMIRIDPNGAAPILEFVLRLRRAARQQKRGNSQHPPHHDLPTLDLTGTTMRSHQVEQRDIRHFQMSRRLPALVQSAPPIEVPR